MPDWQQLLESSGALARGHFRLSSGLHSDAYVQCARLLQEPALARRVGEALAGKLVVALGGGAAAPDSVLAPALGAVIVGHETAAALGVPFRFTERDADGAMTLRRGFALEPGERVVVVEDAVTTGRSTLETVEVAHGLGARVVAVAALLDRSGGRADFGDLPLVTLVSLDLPTHSPEKCPLCAEGTPAEKPGSRPD